MKLFPRSLFGRNALLLVLLIALGQIGGGLLLREMVIKPRLDQIAESVARNVAAIRAGMLALPPAQRPAFVEGFNQQGMWKSRCVRGANKVQLLHSVSCQLHMCSPF